MKTLVQALLFLGILHLGMAQNTPATLASKLLNSMDAAQKEKALLKQDDERRTQWHFFPPSMFKREGITLNELNDEQKELFHQLLHQYLSETGYAKTMNVFTLEGVLRELSGDPVYRDPGNYFLTFYGEPNDETPWSWSFEGHHVSLNFTADGDKVSYVPLFFGANPAIVREGSQKGHRSLVNEEDMGLKLINLLTPKQQKVAIVMPEGTYNDIRSLNKSEIDPFPIEGLAVSEMDPVQQKLLFGLIKEYISAVPREVAEIRLGNVQSEDLKDIHFVWAGGKELGKKHYYRIQGKTFLIEFDNSQNDANHIHAVWRDYDGDFGRDLIREHYATSAHHNN